MPTAEFICIWFEQQHHVLIVDTRSVPSAGGIPAADAPVGWRLVATAKGEEDPARDSPGASAISAWPPFHPVDLPFLVGSEPALRRIEVFDFSPASRPGPELRHATRFVLDRSLTLADAHTWWVAPCHDPKGAWRDGLFGPAVLIGRHVVADGPCRVLMDDIVARACAITRRVTSAESYVIVPAAGDRIGPVVLAQGKPSIPGPVADIVFEPHADGTMQPVIELQAVPGMNLNDVVSCFQFWILRRNAAALNLPELAQSPFPSWAATHLGGRVSITLPAVLHGDVIGILTRGLDFTLASHLQLAPEPLTEDGSPGRVALFVRRELSVSAVTDDRALMLSGRVERLRDQMKAAAPEMTIDWFLSSLKHYLKGVLWRTAIATSYLLEHGLATQARAKLAEIFSADDMVRFDDLAYAVADPAQMEKLLIGRRPFDLPSQKPTAGIDEAVLAACIAEMAGFDEERLHQAGEAAVREVLGDPLAIQAILNIATRSEAMAEWKKAFSVI